MSQNSPDCDRSMYEQSEFEDEELDYESYNSDDYDRIEDGHTADHEELYPEEPSDEVAEDLSELFEGDIDSTVFASVEGEDPEVMAAWSAFGEIRAEEATTATNRTLTPDRGGGFATASGGLGHGDAPYDDYSRPVHDQRSPINFLAPKFEEKDFEAEPGNPPNGAQRVQEALEKTHGSGIHGDTAGSTSSPRTQRENHLAELTGERSTKITQNTMYSPSVGSDFVSEPEDNACVRTYADSHEGSEEGQVGRATPAHNFAADELDHDDRDIPVTPSKPSLLQKRPYLSEITPAVSQSHHPTFIPRSPQKDHFRVSSLGVGISHERLDMQQGKSALTSSIPQQQAGDSSFAPAAAAASQYSQLGSENWTTFRPPTNTSSASSSDGSFPIARPDLGDEIDILCRDKSLKHAQSGEPSRPDTPRPTAASHDLIYTEVSYSQLYDPSMVLKQSESLYERSEIKQGSGCDGDLPETHLSGPSSYDDYPDKLHQQNVLPSETKIKPSTSASSSRGKTVSPTTASNLRPPTSGPLASGTCVDPSAAASPQSYREPPDECVPSHDIKYAATSAPAQLGQATRLFSVSEHADQPVYASQSIPGLFLHDDVPITAPTLLRSDQPPRALPFQERPTQLDQPWQQPPQATIQPLRWPSHSRDVKRSESLKSTKTSNSSDSSMLRSSQIKPEEDSLSLSSPHERLSDPFATNQDEVRFPSPFAGNSPPVSPISGLHDAIYQAKRGSRSTGSSKTSMSRSVTSTRGRAVSASPRKSKSASVVSGNSAAGGIQDAAAKITKTKRGSRARSTSRKVTAGQIESHGDDVPPVPPLPDDMDIDQFETQTDSNTSQAQSVNAMEVEILSPRPSRITKTTSEMMPAKSTRSKDSDQEVALTSVTQNSFVAHQPATSQLKIPMTRGPMTTTSAVESESTWSTESLSQSSRSGTYLRIPNAVRPQTPEKVHEEAGYTIPSQHSPFIRPSVTNYRPHQQTIPPPPPIPKTPKTPSRKSPTKRKPTPSPKRKPPNHYRDQHGHNNVVQDAPRTPDPKNRPAAKRAGAGAGTGNETATSTPQSGGRNGIKKEAGTPSRSSPRLRGEKPGPGLDDSADWLL